MTVAMPSELTLDKVNQAVQAILNVLEELAKLEGKTVEELISEVLDSSE